MDDRTLTSPPQQHKEKKIQWKNARVEKKEMNNAHQLLTITELYKRLKENEIIQHEHLKKHTQVCSSKIEQAA